MQIESVPKSAPEGVELARSSQTLARQAGTTLARAFALDPMMAHVEPRDQRRRQVLPQLFTLSARYALALGGLEQCGENGFALWLTSRSEPTYWDTLRYGLWRMPFVLGWRAVLRMMRHEAWCAMRLAQLAPRHYGYLWVLGVEPEVHGRGWGRGALDAAVAQMANAGLAWCFLKTEQAGNVPLYERLGFTCVERTVAAPSGLTTWFFRRPTLALAVTALTAARAAQPPTACRPAAGSSLAR
jgi:ribosomal protein S18 acetylase RimI-like enzyme